MAHDMSADERREFLLEVMGTGKVATTRADGRPHVTPVWFTLDVPTVAVASCELLVRVTPTRVVTRTAMAE
jgi:Pyridoxamine 5'-phosphate oxidase